MNNLLKKNIALYSGIAGAIFLADDSKAQIIYYDVNPDTLIYPYIQTYSIDMNADGTQDFEIQGITGYNIGHYISGGASGPHMVFSHKDVMGLFPEGSSSYYNAVLTKFNSCYPNPANHLLPTDLIKASAPSWSNSNGTEGPIIYYDGGSCGSWPIGTSYSAGLKFLINSVKHFGWIKIKVVSDTSMIVEGYAYESQPGVSIIAGRTSSTVGIEEVFNSTKIIQDGNQIRMNFDSKINNAKITVSNILGQEISSQDFSGDIFETEISSKGIFMIHLSSEKMNVVKKVFIY